MALSAKRPSQTDATRQRLMQDVVDSKEPTKRLNADIPESLYSQMKVKAAQEGRTIADVTRTLWIEYLSK